jgi:hypothetical protein
MIRAGSPGIGVEGDVESLVDGREQVHRLPSSAAARGALVPLRQRGRGSAHAGEASAPGHRRSPPPRSLLQRPRGGHRSTATGSGGIRDRTAELSSHRETEVGGILGETAAAVFCFSTSSALRVTWADKNPLTMRD